MQKKLDAISLNSWVIIPANNEEKYLANVLEKLTQLTKNVIVVDDGSRDKTAAIARQFTSHVLIHRVNLGKGAALKTGCEYAFEKLRTSSVIFIDADDQHDPAELPKFWQKLDEGYEVVFGARQIEKNMPWVRTTFNKLDSTLIQLFFGAYIPDVLSGYKAIAATAYPKIKWQTTNYAVEMEIAARVARKHIRFAVVPIKTIYHDFNRGMTMFDAFGIVGQLINWKFSL